MICGSETTAVTEHICSKMRQLSHELRNVLNSESTTCFTDGHKRSDAALPAATVVIPNFVPFVTLTSCPSFLTRSYTFLSGHLQVDACSNKREQLARRQGHPWLRFVHGFVRAVFKARNSCGWRHFNIQRTIILQCGLFKTAEICFDLYSCCCCCFSHSAYWLPTRKKYFTWWWPIPLVVC